MNSLKPATSLSWADEPAAPAYPVQPDADGTTSAREDGDSPFADLRALLRRNGAGLLVWTLFCLLAAGVYLWRATPQYLATTQIVLEPRRQILIGSDQSSSGGPVLDSAQADSQVQVIKSERNLRFVFDTLNLRNDPQYANAGPGLVQRLVARVTGAPPATASSEQERVAAFQSFTDRVQVRRIAQSYALEISFIAATPSDAARLANSITAAYILDQIQFHAAGIQRGTEFLQGRIADIKTEQAAATDAVRQGVIPDMQFADSDARVVGAALPPLSRAFPQTQLILGLSIGFALLSGCGVIALRHSLDRTVRSRGQIMNALGLDLLAVLPRHRSGKSRFAERGSLAPTVVIDDPGSAFAHGMRNLRAALFYAGAKPRHLAIGIVSFSSREGRSTLAANLAYVLAASSTATTLIDGDLQKPTLTLSLAPDASRGLSDILTSHQQNIDLPRITLSRDLDFVPALAAGQSPDPNLFLAAEAMQRDIVRERETRNVVIDLPPLRHSPEAQAIGRLLDGVVMVVEVDRSSLDEVNEAVRMLRSAAIPLLGIVLNKMPGTGEHRRS